MGLPLPRSRVSSMVINCVPSQCSENHNNELFTNCFESIETLRFDNDNYQEVSPLIKELCSSEILTFCTPVSRQTLQVAEVVCLSCWHREYLLLCMHSCRPAPSQPVLCWRLSCVFSPGWCCSKWFTSYWGRKWSRVVFNATLGTGINIGSKSIGWIIFWLPAPGFLCIS